MPIKAVIFDLFDVLITPGPSRELSAFEARVGLPAGGLFRELLRPPHYGDAVAGNITGEELWQRVADRIGVDRRQWSEIAAAWSSSGSLNADLIEFIRGLPPHLKTAILSNAPSDVRELATARFRLDRDFDLIVISAEERAEKPWPEIYRLTTERLGVRPDEAVFVDDEAQFVRGAESAGLHGIRYVDNAQVRRDISRLLGL